MKKDNKTGYRMVSEKNCFSTLLIAIFFSLFELQTLMFVYFMDPLRMDETLQTPAEVVSGTSL